jgi:GNAT superfamily N-acetyltransferase
MIVRPGRFEDLDELVEMGSRMHKEGAYSFLPYDHEKVRQLIASYINDSETQCGLIAEENTRIVGMFAGYLIDYFFCNETIACDMVLYVDQPYRGSSAAVRLVRAFREWAIDRGAREICLSISTNIAQEKTGRFYEKLGLVHSGDVYKERLK